MGTLCRKTSFIKVPNLSVPNEKNEDIKEEENETATSYSHRKYQPYEQNLPTSQPPKERLARLEKFLLESTHLSGTF